MSKLSPIRELSRFLVSLRFDDLPKEVQDKAKVCIYDVFACACAGYNLPWSLTARETAKEMGDKKEAALFVYGDRCSAAEAAFVNAVLAQSIVWEDSHVRSLSHPGTVVIPTALAVGEKIKTSGKDVLVAIVAGYEAMCRVGMSICGTEFNLHFRPTGYFGPFGSAAAAAKILGFNEDDTASVLGLAGNLGLGLVEFGWAGTNEWYFHNGFAARNGIAAAILTQKGLKGPESILDGKGGLWAAFGGEENAAEVTRDLGKSYEMLNVIYKIAPACGRTGCTAQLMLDIVKSRDVKPEEIDEIKEITIKTSRHAKMYTGLDYSGPFSTITQVRFSQQFAAASVLVFREISNDNYLKYDDPSVAKLAQKVKVVVDSHYDELLTKTAKSGARIEVVMNDGRVISREQDDVRYPEREDIVQSYKMYAVRTLGESKAVELASKIEDLENLKDISDLARCFVK